MQLGWGLPHMPRRATRRGKSLEQRKKRKQVFSRIPKGLQIARVGVKGMDPLLVCLSSKFTISATQRTHYVLKAPVVVVSTSVNAMMWRKQSSKLGVCIIPEVSQQTDLAMSQALCK